MAYEHSCSAFERRRRHSPRCRQGSRSISPRLEPTGLAAEPALESAPEPTLAPEGACADEPASAGAGSELARSPPASAIPAGMADGVYNLAMERALVASRSDADETAAFLAWLRGNHPAFEKAHTYSAFDLDTWLRIFESVCPRRLRAEYTGVTAACEDLLCGASGHEALILRESDVRLDDLNAARVAAAECTRAELQACKERARVRVHAGH